MSESSQTALLTAVTVRFAVGLNSTTGSPLAASRTARPEGPYPSNCGGPAMTNRPSGLNSNSA